MICSAITGEANYIAMRDGAERAIGYINRVEDFCRNLSAFPNRGIRRDDLRPGLRALGFERRRLLHFAPLPKP